MTESIDEITSKNGLQEAVMSAQKVHADYYRFQEHLIERRPESARRILLSNPPVKDCLSLDELRIIYDYVEKKIEMATGRLPYQANREITQQDILMSGANYK